MDFNVPQGDRYYVDKFNSEFTSEFTSNPEVFFTFIYPISRYIGVSLFKRLNSARKASSFPPEIKSTLVSQSLPSLFFGHGEQH